MPLGDAFLRQLRATFMVEAREHVQSLTRGLLQLEKSADGRARAGIVEAVFRTVHSLKGAARAVEQPGIESICQALEDVFAGWRRDPAVPTQQTMDLLYRALDAIEALLSDSGAASGAAELMALRRELRRIGTAETEMPQRGFAAHGATPATPRPHARGAGSAAHGSRDARVEAPDGPAAVPSATPRTGGSDKALAAPALAAPVSVQDATPAPAQDATPAPAPASAPDATAAPATASPQDATAAAAPPSTPASGNRSATAATPAARAGVGQHDGPARLGALSEGTVRVTLAKLEQQLRQTEDLLASKLAARERVADLQALDAWFEQWHKTRAELKAVAGGLGLRALAESGNPQVAGAGGLRRVLELFDASDAAIQSLEDRLAEMGRRALHDRDEVAKSVDQLLEHTKRLLRLPFSSISASFERLVRDLCRAQEKQADLLIEGEHIEVDKRILEQMKDPLVHMLRNAVDHAVELPSVRMAQGKPARATISLAVSQEEGNRVRIVLSDDGAGIATEQLKETAVRRGVLSEDEAAHLDERTAQRLVFRSEISTGREVTPLSGRGLGLAIVRENTQRLGGKVRVRSTPGQGTRFEITLPALHANFRAILCEAGGRPFLIPVSQVERVARVAIDSLRTVEGRRTVTMGDSAVALVRLADLLGRAAPPSDTGTRGELELVVVNSGEQSLALAVDRVVDEQEILVKPLRRPLLRVRNVAAVAVLGSGALVPLLHVGDLLVTARHHAAQRPPTRAESQAAGPAQILLAEDSITSRLLLKSLLESAGFSVTTAVDGQDALAQLRERSFDLLVSDVEMPRLDGFELTRRLRADRALAALPVVLVTTLASRGDQERGIDAGANAYIVKGGFDQDTLIGAVRRLL